MSPPINWINFRDLQETPGLRVPLRANQWPGNPSRHRTPICVLRGKINKSSKTAYIYIYIYIYGADPGA